jgi:hypothetical protein
MGEHDINYIVDIAVESTLLKLGFDMENPIAIQKDIQHLRRSREICELIQNKVIATIILVILTAGLGVAWAGVSIAIDKNHVEMRKK